jgi:hypothetical protein
MRKIFIIVLFILTGMSACQKKGFETVLGDPNERLFDTLAVRKEALVASTHGWKTVFSPKGGGTYLFWMKFDAHDRVDMISDLNSTTAGEVKNSSYVIKSIEKPGVIFDTYNYLHILSHPQNSTSGGVNGEGKVSDYEFWFKTVTKDSIVLEGMRNKNVMVLHRATEAEETFFKSGGINRIMNEAIALMDGKFLRLTEGTNQIPTTINFNNKRVTLMKITTGNTVVESSSDFTFDADGLNLVMPIVYDGKTFTKIYWDDVNKVFYLLNGTVKVFFEVSTSPTVLPYTPPAQDLLYPGEFTFLKINPATIPQQGKFGALLQEDIDRVNAAARTYSYLYFNFQPAETDGTISLNVRTASSTYYIGIYYYKMVWIDKPNGIFKLEYVRANTSTASTLSYSQSLRAFLVSHTFKLAYLAIPGPANAKIVGMVSREMPDMFLYGAAGSVLANLP